jgi:hypothetical protein
MHATVDATSAPGARFVTVVVPDGSAPSMTYRWEIDLSPGTASVPRTALTGRSESERRRATVTSVREVKVHP